MQGLKNTYTAIDSNRQMWERLSKSDALSTKPQLNYSSSEVQYYNDEVDIKKKKRKKAAKWLTLGFAGITILSTISALAVQIARGKITRADINNVVGAGKQTAGAMSNRMVNLDICKNDLWSAFSDFISEKTPFKINKWFNQPISAKYCKLASSKNAAAHDSAKAIILPHMKNLGITETTYSYTEASNAIYDEIHSKLNVKGERTFDILKKAFQDGYKKQNPNESFIQRFKRGMSNLWDISGKSIIADDKIRNLYSDYTQGLVDEYLPKGVTKDMLERALSKDKTIADNAFDELVKVIRKSLPDSCNEDMEKYLNEQIDLRVIADTAKKGLKRGTQQTLDSYDKVTMHREDFDMHYKNNLAETLAKALMEIHELETKGMTEGIAKMRDIATGDSAFEVVTMLGSLGTLGVAVAAEDEKEKRKSTVINLGIPLVSTLGFSLFGSFINLDKKFAAPIGLVLGTLVSQGAKALDKLITKNKNKTETKA